MPQDGAGSFRVISTPTAAGGCFTCSSKPGSIFCDLPQARLLELDQLRRARIYPAGATLFFGADQPRGVYCVGSGRVRLSRSSPDGRSVGVRIATAGDVLGVRPLLLGKTHDLLAETIDEARVCCIPRNDFLDFLKRHGDVGLRLAQRLSTEIDGAYQQVCSLILKTPTERLAELLLALSQTHGEPGPDGIRLSTGMSQDELASMIGVSRRSLCRAFETLRERGFVACRRRSIIIRNEFALRNSLISIE